MVYAMDPNNSVIKRLWCMSNTKRKVIFKAYLFHFILSIPVDLANSFISKMEKSGLGKSLMAQSTLLWSFGAG